MAIRKHTVSMRERKGDIRGSIERGKVNAEYTLPNGDTITIKPSEYCEGGGYDVDCWDADNANRWHRFFFVLEDAISEFKRWR